MSSSVPLVRGSQPRRVEDDEGQFGKTVRVKPSTTAEDVPRSNLTVTLGNNAVLDPDPVAGVRIGLRVIFVRSAVTLADLLLGFDELNPLDPLDHLVAQLVLHA